MSPLLFKRIAATVGLFILHTSVSYGLVNIVTQPSNVTVADGAKITLSVSATSTESKQLLYTWKKTGQTAPVQNESNNSQFVISSAKAGDTGTYTVVIREVNSDLSVTSDAAQVTVHVRPRILVQPAAPLTPRAEGSQWPFTVEVDASGAKPFSYTWQKRVGTTYVNVGTPVVKSDLNDTLTLTNLSLADAGIYRVSITNDSNVVVNSRDVTLRVNSRPVIVTEPAANLNVVFGATGSLRVSVGGNAPFIYRWLKNGIVIPKSNSPTLTIKGTDNPAGGVAEGPGNYKVQVVNAFSPNYPLDKTTDPFTVATITESTVTAAVRVVHRPKILNKLSNLTIDFTGAVPVNRSLQVLVDDFGAAGDEGDLSYQWFKDNKPISNVVDGIVPIVSGTNTPQIVFTPVTKEQVWAVRGSYRLVVTTRVGTTLIGTATSNSAVVTVISPPIITSQSPTEVYGAIKGSVRLFVTATGTTPLTYKWFFRPISSATYNTKVMGTSASLTLSGLSNAVHHGFWKCEVGNAPRTFTANTITSNEIFVQADEAPKITQQTALDTSVTTSTKVIIGNKLGLRVAASGTNRPADEPAPGTLKANPLNYQWLFNNQPIVGANTANLLIDPAQAINTGRYSCRIWNNSGTVTSTALSITVSGPPTITAQPTPNGGPNTQFTAIEESALETTAIVATGSPTIKFRWEKKITGEENWLVVSGKTSSKLTFASLKLQDGGIYRCEVYNDYTNSSNKVYSNPVEIIVNPIPSPTLGAQPGISTVQFYPRVARPGEKVRIFGANLRYVKEVKLGASSCAPITIESDNSILVTVPPATAPLMSNVPFEVKSVNPVSTFTTDGFSQSLVYANIEPLEYSGQEYGYRILEGTTVVADGDTTGSFSTILRRIPGATGASTTIFSPAYFTWKVKTNSVVGINVQGSTRYDCALRVLIEDTAGSFLGPDGVTRYSAKGLSSVLGNSFESVPSFILGPNRSVLIIVQTNVPLYNGFQDPEGLFRLRCTSSPTTLTASNIDQRVQSDTTKGKDLASTGDLSSSLEGSLASAAEPEVIWSASSSKAALSTGNVSFSMSLKQGSASSDDQFTWQFNDAENNGLAALWVNPTDGSIRYVNASGETVTAARKLDTGGESSQFEVRFDAGKDSLTILMDGEALIPAQKLADGVQINGVSATWDLGTDGKANGASVFYNDFRVEPAAR